MMGLFLRSSRALRAVKEYFSECNPDLTLVRDATGGELKILDNFSVRLVTR